MSPHPKMTARSQPFDWSPFGIGHPAPFSCDLEVTRNELSRTIDHVSNIEYVRWLDLAAELHADSLGFPRSSLLEQEMMWFVARHEIDYRAEAWAGDHLVVGTWVRDVGRAKTWRDTVIVRPSTGTIVCQASTLWVLVNLTSRRPIRITAEMVRRFAPVERASD